MSWARAERLVGSPRSVPGSRHRPISLRSLPCSKSGSMCLSATLAAEVATECTDPSLLSTPICAFSLKWRVGRGNLPLSPLSDPYVTLSRHTAPVIQPYPQPPASDETTAVRHPSAFVTTAHCPAFVPVSYTHLTLPTIY